MVASPRAVKIAGINSPGSSGGSGGVSTVAPADVLAIVVSGILDPVSNIITLSVSVTPPVGSTFAGCHLFLEIPDQSNLPAQVVGVTPVGGTAAVTGSWAPVDLGVQSFVTDQQPWTIQQPAPVWIDPSVDTPCRLYACSFSSAVDNILVRANLPSPTPNQTFTLISLASGTPSAATNVTSLAGTITASVMPDDNSTGKLKTPVLVQVANVPTNITGWQFQVVLTWEGTDASVTANQIAVTGAETDAGPVYAAADGIIAPHTFALDTPTAPKNATLWLQSGLVDKDGISNWNNIVPGITPSCPITVGTLTGTTDAASVMLASLMKSMTVVNKLFGVADMGIDNPLLGHGAVGTINVQALAIDNPLLANLVVQSRNMSASSVNVNNQAMADLAVQARNMAASSVTASNQAIGALAVGVGAIAALAVGTASIQLLAIENGLIANLAVDFTKIANATITSAKIGFAEVADINIGTCNVSKLVAGSALFTADVTLARGFGLPTLVLSSAGITLASGGATSMLLSAASLSVTNNIFALSLSSSSINIFASGGPQMQLSAASLIFVYGSTKMSLTSSSMSMTTTFTNAGIFIDGTGTVTCFDPSGTATVIAGHTIGTNTISAFLVSTTELVMPFGSILQIDGSTVVRVGGPGGPTGYNGTVSGAVAAGRNVINGIIF